MKIVIYQNREVYKENNKIGNDLENKVETLEFEFPEEYKDFTKYIEFQIKDEKYVDLIENDKYIITRSIAKFGKIKAQIVLRNSIKNDVAVFKSDIFELKVSKSINATIDVPIEYPTWVDNLTKLKQELEKAESERVSNENERISAEEERQDNFTEMQETVENAASNIKDLKEDYNENTKQKTEKFNNNFEEKQNIINNTIEEKTELFNADFTEKIKKFNDNADEQTKTFNDNSDSKLAEYDKNHTDKIKEYDDNSKAKLDAYNENDTDKTNAYNANDIAKTKAYNDNTVLKEKVFNDIVTESTEAFNTNVEQKETELEKLAEKKINEYNQVSAELTAKVKQVQAENKLIKEQIPSASMSGNSIHVEDSGTLDFDWKIRGGHKQKTREGYQLLNLQSGMQNGITYYVDDEGYFCISGTCTSDRITLNLNELVLNGTYTFTNKSISGGGINCALKDNTSEYKNIFFTNNKNETKEVNTILKDLVCYLTNGATYNSKIKLMLVSGSQEKDIELYGVSPSPDCPSEVETVGSNVNILENKAISQTLNGVDFLVKEDKSIIVNGTSTDRINFVLSSNNKLKAGTYTLSGCPDGGSVSSYHLDVALIGTKTYLIDNGSSNTAKLDNDLDNLTYRILIEKGVTLNSVVFKPKLEEGIVATSYSPYGMGSVEVKVINKNWLTNFENINNTNSGITMVGNKDNVKVSGTATKAWVSSNYAELENLQAGNYIFSYSSEQGLRYKIWIYNSEKSAIIYNLGLNQKISVPQNYKKLFFRIILENLTAGQIVNDTAYFQIEKGSTSTDIVEHQSQTAIMPVQQEMLDGDYIEGVEHHEWERLVLMGDNVSGRWTVDGGNEYRFVIAVDNMLPASSITEKTNIICNTLKTVSALDTYNKIEGIACDKNSNILIYIEECKDMTVEEFKAYLNQKYNSGTPVTIYYKLATPLNLELTEEQKAIRDTKLYTYKNITNISVDNELASIDVEYKKDPTTEHDDLQNQIDEIKQLLSTTQTSALLLDNLQKDVESEVE
mgnify:CR=1 FL=1